MLEILQRETLGSICFFDGRTHEEIANNFASIYRALKGIEKDPHGEHISIKYGLHVRETLIPSFVNYFSERARTINKRNF